MIRPGPASLAPINEMGTIHSSGARTPVGRGLFIDNRDAALALTKPGISVEAPNSLLSIPLPSVVLYLPGTLYGQK